MLSTAWQPRNTHQGLRGWRFLINCRQFEKNCKGTHHEAPKCRELDPAHLLAPKQFPGLGKGGLLPLLNPATPPLLDEKMPMCFKHWSSSRVAGMVPLND